MRPKIRAAVVSGPGEIDIQDLDLPKLAPQDFIMKTEMCGICGTDLHLINSLKGFEAEISYPFILGHEFVGTIDEVGKDFEKVDVTGLPLEAGDRVAVSPDGNIDTPACGVCYYCKNGLSFFCANRATRIPPLPPTIRGWQRGYADYRYTHAVEAVYRLPQGMPPEVGVLVEPLSIAIYAFERAYQPGTPWLFQGMGPGKIVVVQGSGTIGLLLTLLSKLCGAYKTIVIGAPNNRLEMCSDFGADITVSIEEIKNPKERIKKVKELTPFNKGADIVFEAAGVPSAFTEGIEMVRSGGIFIELGHFTDRGLAEVNPFTVVSKNLSIIGSYGGGAIGFLSAVRLLESYRKTIAFEKIVTHKFPLDKVREALETARRYECMKAVLTF